MSIVKRSRRKGASIALLLVAVLCSLPSCGKERHEIESPAGVAAASAPASVSDAIARIDDHLISDATLLASWERSWTFDTTAYRLPSPSERMNTFIGLAGRMIAEICIRNDTNTDWHSMLPDTYQYEVRCQWYQSIIDQYPPVIAALSEVEAHNMSPKNAFIKYGLEQVYGLGLAGSEAQWKSKLDLAQQLGFRALIQSMREDLEDARLEMARLKNEGDSTRIDAELQDALKIELLSVQQEMRGESGSLIGNTARELERQGRFEIYIPAYRERFWQEYPSAEMVASETSPTRASCCADSAIQ